MTNLDANRIQTLAELLLEARSEGLALAPIDQELIPESLAEAEAVDDAVAARIGRRVVGWKVGCTSAHAQELLGSDGPFAGRVYDLHQSGVTLAATEFVTEPHLEGEFAFTMSHDLEPTAQERSRDEVINAVADVRAAIEIVGGRYEQFIGTPLHSVIADAGANTRLVVGEPATDWDPAALVDTAATMTVDDAVTGQGHGRDVLGDPIEALRWLVNRLSARGITLEAGMTVTTGTATQVSALPPGATARNVIDGLGSVSLHRAG